MGCCVSTRVYPIEYISEIQQKKTSPNESVIKFISIEDRESALEVSTELQCGEANTKHDKNIENTEVHKGILSEEKEIEQLTKGQTQPQTLEDRRSGRLIGVVHTTEEEGDETKYKGDNEGLLKTDNLEEKGILFEVKEIEQLTKGQTQPQTLEDRRSGRLIGVVHTTEEKDDETKYKGENEGLQKTDNLEEKYKNADEHQSCKPETNESEEIIKERTDDYDKKNYIKDDRFDEKLAFSETIRKETKDDFSAIELHASQAPQAVLKSVETLVEYLLKLTNSEKGKVWAFYVWIACNIQYDMESLVRERFNAVDAESVLKSGSSVCGGYANLFEKMCRVAGLSVKVISGFSKANGYSPERPFTSTTQTDHAWNAVLIENSWRFVECTWGAGYTDQSGKFKKCFSDFYFLTDPKHFISAHFPWKSGDLEYCNKWQLLHHPITLEQFNKMLKLEENALMWDISPLSHTEGVIEAHEEVEIVIEDKMERLCSTGVKFYNCKTGKSFDEYTFLRRENPKTIAVSLRPPSNGTYQLNVYGNIDQLEKSHDQLMSYVIKFSNVTTDSNPYPFNHGQMWGMSLEAFENGFQAADRYNIPTKLRSENGYFDLKLNTTRNLPTIARIEPATKQLPGDKRRYCLVSGTDNELNIRACFPDRDLYKLQVLCQKVEDEKYHEMAVFLIDCTKPADPGLPYPATYSSTQEYRCKLIEPLEGQLPVNSSVTCRFQSPLVLNAMVAETKMKQEGNEWWATVTTPRVGEKFRIFGNISDENTYYGLFEYDIV